MPGAASAAGDERDGGEQAADDAEGTASLQQKATPRPPPVERSAAQAVIRGQKRHGDHVPCVRKENTGGAYPDCGESSTAMARRGACP